MVRNRLILLSLFTAVTLNAATGAAIAGDATTAPATSAALDKPKPPDKPKPKAPDKPKTPEKPKATPPAKTPEKPKEAEKGKAITIGSEVDGGLTLTDIDAKAHKLSDLRGKVVVVQFWSAHAPTTAPYDKRIAELVAAQSAKGVVFIAIDSDKADVEGAKDPAVALRDALKAHGLEGKLPLVQDKDGALMTQFGAKASGPHAFVIDAKGMLRYSGAIDDDPAGDRKEGVKHYLTDALDAVIAGKPVAVPTTTPGESGKK